MPVKRAEPYRPGYWWVECPYCKSDNTTDCDPRDRGERITCASCGKVFISGGWEV